MSALPKSRRLFSFPNEDNYERFDFVTYIVTKDEIFVGHGEHDDLLEKVGFDESDPANWPVLHARYFPGDFPGDDGLWISLDTDDPREILEGGRYEDHFARLYNHEKRINPKTRVSFNLGQTYRVLGDLLASQRPRETSVPSIPQRSIEGYYPSGTPIHFGDRRPIHVREHRRRAT